MSDKSEQFARVRGNGGNRSKVVSIDPFEGAKVKPYGEKAYAIAFRPPAEDKRLSLITGAVRSSKTWTMIPKLLNLCRYQVSGRRIITGVSKDAIYNNILDDLFEIIGPDNYYYNRQSGHLELWGSKWRVVGARDEGSEKYIRGSTIGIAYCDELSLMPQSFFNMLLSRMSPKGARFYGTTNPDSPYHWLMEDVIQNEKFRDVLFHETFTLDDNPNLDDEYREFVRRSYHGLFYQRYILGLWVLAEGAIYRDVLNEACFYTNATRPSGLHTRGFYMEHWIAVDYGTVNPCVFIDCYDDGKSIWFDREYRWDSRVEMRQKSDSDYADDMLQFVRDTGPDYEDPRMWPGIIIDPSAASLKVELTRRGFSVYDADNDVEDGIRRVSTMIANGLVKFNRDGCEIGLREMSHYVWNEIVANKGVEQPLKSRDHFPDAVRYMIKTRMSDWRLAA